MGIYHLLKEKIKAKGVKNTIQYLLQKGLGIDTYAEQLQALHYFLDVYNDITKLPPTKDPDLRIMQECDAIQLALLGKIFKKHGLTWWMDYGTLLGAVRHTGFIPWDDDMDISMRREDVKKAYSILKETLEPYGFEIYKNNGGTLGVGYKHSKTGVWCDICPVDDRYLTEPFDENKSRLREQAEKYRSESRRLKHKMTDEKRRDLIEKYLPQSDAKGKHVFFCLEFGVSMGRIFNEDVIYPLSTVMFEGYEFPAPGKVREYLTGIFGEYMSFPTWGVLHHGTALGRLPLSQWAKANSIDMQEVKAYLLEVLNKSA